MQHVGSEDSSNEKGSRRYDGSSGMPNKYKEDVP